MKKNFRTTFSYRMVTFAGRTVKIKRSEKVLVIYLAKDIIPLRGIGLVVYSPEVTHPVINIYSLREIVLFSTSLLIISKSHFNYCKDRIVNRFSFKIKNAGS